MKNLSPLLSTDYYKTVHHNAYKDKLEKLTSYWTPRMTRIKEIDKIVMFGLQAFIKESLIDRFNKDFFERPLEDVITEYKRIVSCTMGSEYADTKHIEQLHKLGYLPIEIKAISEGVKVPVKVPMFSITNTDNRFAWLVNYLETYMSCNVWQPMTSASIANRFMEIVSEYYEKTGCERDVRTACGDFSMRGMSSEDSACKSSAGHLLSFTSTATIPVVNWLEQFYNADVEKELICRGTPSTEHSVMCTYGRDELECFRHLITEAFPKGNLSIVGDTYDYWNILTDILPQLKEDIMARDGKVIIRGDSGDPVDIICGENVKTFETENDFLWFTKDKSCKFYGQIVYVEEIKKYFTFTNESRWINTDRPSEVRGTVEILWELFGGHINEKGYKVLDTHIGTIYGDGITLERCKLICERLESKGFATENVTFGVGSYSYQYTTRDTFGFALKATDSIIDGIETPIYKDPKTDTGNFKKSQRGLCIVYKGEDGKITFEDGLTHETYAGRKNQVGDLLEPVFRNSKLLKVHTLAEIRERLSNE